MTKSVRKAIDGKGKCHLVGHDLGGLLALHRGDRAPQRVARGDRGGERRCRADRRRRSGHLTLAHPPGAAVEPRIAALGARARFVLPSPHRRCAARRLRLGGHGTASSDRTSSQPSLMKAKSRFYEVCRDRGHQGAVPGDLGQPRSARAPSTTGCGCSAASRRSSARPSSMSSTAPARCRSARSRRRFTRSFPPSSKASLPEKKSPGRGGPENRGWNRA